MTLTNSNIKMSHQNMWKDNVQENKSYNLGEVITTQLLCRINKDLYRQIKKKTNRKLHRQFKQVFNRKGNRAKKLRNVNENFTEIQFYNYW